jgi:hypothetical protein
MFRRLTSKIITKIGILVNIEIIIILSSFVRIKAPSAAVSKLLGGD